MSAYTRDNREFRQKIADRAAELRQYPKCHECGKRHDPTDETACVWDWCEACGSWHHADNPTCVLLRAQFVQMVGRANSLVLPEPRRGIWERVKGFMLVFYMVGQLIAGTVASRRDNGNQD